ncbi:hypothetical protein PHLGIDRAFT_116686 [Phlebiopsis gigantea 11061_1 CR5-6]|uniref:FAD-binding domain-containing protein n=1 Tax=Phlebiopsis gigantea (strain 11061_1 CR5-6) TaxID=745531 RepID=A0A0C3PQ11_PHLG1|nr:hypothetical protein PHLGIDRAFT_116686 [Phlebiopsis gigantea 11061_1 CR5-6]
MSPLPSRTDVLIVGAGPAGLTAALSLHNSGCKDIVVVDSALAADSTSRAIATHAATFEALDRVAPGCADQIVARGNKSSAGRVWDGYNFIKFANFDVLKGHTKYPFILFTPQTVVERILGDRAQEEGIQVCRPHKVVNLAPNADDSNITDVFFEDGRVVQARCVVGADGTKSIVRTIAGISYSDPDGEDPTSEDLKLGVIADVKLDAPVPDGGIMAFHHGTFFLCIPLPPACFAGAQVYRIAYGVPLGTPPHAPPREYLQTLDDAFGLGAHPPTGGQGMNLGIRDAVFLGPVLAAHVARAAAGDADRAALDAPLQAWAANRHETALKVIRLAKAGLARASIKDETTWYLGFVPVNWLKLRNFMLWIMTSTGIMPRLVPWQLSGLKNP